MSVRSLLHPRGSDQGGQPSVQSGTLSPHAPATPRQREQGLAPPQHWVLYQRVRPLMSQPLGLPLIQVPQAPLVVRSLWAFRVQGSLLGPRPALERGLCPLWGLEGVCAPASCRSGPTRTWGTHLAAEAGWLRTPPIPHGEHGATGRGARPFPAHGPLWAGRWRELGSRELDRRGACGAGSAQGRCVPRPPRP